MDENNRPMLGHADLQALLSGLPPSIRGQAYLDFLDRLEAAGALRATGDHAHQVRSGIVFEQAQFPAQKCLSRRIGFQLRAFPAEVDDDH